jgi:hypothetical protein
MRHAKPGSVVVSLLLWLFFTAPSGIATAEEKPARSGGGSSHQPVPADYDGDGADEFGIFRADDGLWAVRGLTRAYYGTSGDIAVTR